MLGGRAEQFAREVLVREGYVLVAQNVRTPKWEIDIVAWEEKILCFVEVRSTRTLEHGGPLATITRDKQRHIVRAARAYVAERRELDEAFVRFDVIGIWGEEGAYRHELVRGAFVAES